MMGSGIGSVPFERLLASIKSVFAAAGRAGFRVASKEFPLSEIATAWTADAGRARAVITIGNNS